MRPAASPQRAQPAGAPYSPCFLPGSGPLSPLPWQCQTSSLLHVQHDLWALPLPGRLSHNGRRGPTLGFAPHSHHVPPSRMVPERAGALAQPRRAMGLPLPQESRGREMETCPLAQGLGVRAGKQREKWSSAPAGTQSISQPFPTLALWVQLGASCHSGTLMQHSHPGLSQSPPCTGASEHGCQPTGTERRSACSPKCCIDRRPSALILKCLPAAVGV